MNDGAARLNVVLGSPFERSVSPKTIQHGKAQRISRRLLWRKAVVVSPHRRIVAFLTRDFRASISPHCAGSTPQFERRVAKSKQVEILVRLRSMISAHPSHRA